MIFDLAGREHPAIHREGKPCTSHYVAEAAGWVNNMEGSGWCRCGTRGFDSLYPSI